MNHTKPYQSTNNQQATNFQIFRFFFNNTNHNSKKDNLKFLSIQQMSLPEQTKNGLPETMT